MREDIVGGLRNALERGASLEQAIRSFMNAGYAETDVRDAAKLLEGGAITFALQQPTRGAPALPQALPRAQPQPVKQQPVMMQNAFQVQRPTQRPSLLIIILCIILLLSIASFVFSLMFKKEIADFLTRLLGG